MTSFRSNSPLLTQGPKEEEEIEELVVDDSRSPEEQVAAALAFEPNENEEQAAEPETQEAETPKPAEAQPEESPASLEEVLMKEMHSASSVGAKCFKGQNYARAAQQYSRAIEIAEQLSSSEANILSLYSNRSAVYEKLEQYDDAMADCLVVLVMNPSNIKVRKRRARIFQAQGNFRNALTELCAVMLGEREATRKKFESYEGHPHYAALLQQNLPQPPDNLEPVMAGVAQQEVELLMEERKTSPLPPHIPTPSAISQMLLSYSEYLEREKGARSKLPKALAEEVDAARESGDKAALIQALDAHAFRLMTDRKFTEAQADFVECGKIIEENPDVVQPSEASRILRWMSFFEHIHFRLDEALTLLDKAQSVYPCPENLVRKSGVYTDLSNYIEAERMLTEAAEDEEIVDLLVHRSQLHIMNQRLDLALADLDQAVKMSPNHILAVLRLATLKVHAQDVAGALTLVDRALELRPTLSETLQVKADLCIAEGKYDEAFELLDKSIECDRGNSNAYVEKASLLFQKGDVTEAIENFELAIKADPSCNAAYLRKAQFQLQLVRTFDEVDQVIRDLSTAISRARDPEELKELCMLKVLAQCQIEGAKELGMSGFAS